MNIRKLQLPLRMRAEFSIDLCWIRLREEGFQMAEWAEQYMERVFDGVGYWYVDARNEEDAEIAVAEVRGIAAWRDEEEAVAFMDNRTDDEFWKFLQGYRVRVTAYEETACCHKGR